MKRLFSIVAAVVFAAMVGISLASDSSVDNWIKDLKSDNLDVRVKAAHELGCG
jgi:hypothetical protein